MAGAAHDPRGKHSDRARERSEPAPSEAVEGAKQRPRLRLRGLLFEVRPFGWRENRVCGVPVPRLLPEVLALPLQTFAWRPAGAASGLTIGRNHPLVKCLSQVI